MSELENQELIKEKLETLREEHNQLEDELQTLVSSPVIDQITIQRLKKKKLILKDQVVQLSSKLLPDIIA